MITILIANDEEKIKGMLTGLLRKEGYALSDKTEADGEVIRVSGRTSAERPAPDVGTLRDKVLELEESLYRSSKGELYKAIVEAIERPLIESVLERTEGNQLMAARILGLNRNTIRSKIKKLSIDIERWKTRSN